MTTPLYSHKMSGKWHGHLLLCVRLATDFLFSRLLLFLHPLWFYLIHDRTSWCHTNYHTRNLAQSATQVKIYKHRDCTFTILNIFDCDINNSLENESKKRLSAYFAGLFLFNDHSQGQTRELINMHKLEWAQPYVSWLCEYFITKSLLSIGLVGQEFLIQGQELHHSLLKMTAEAWAVLLIHTNGSVNKQCQKSLLLRKVLNKQIYPNYTKHSIFT